MVDLDGETNVRVGWPWFGCGRWKVQLLSSGKGGPSGSLLEQWSLERTLIVDPTPENGTPDDEHLSLDEMLSGYDESQEDYSLEELSQAYAQILAEQESLQVPVPGDREPSGDDSPVQLEPDTTAPASDSLSAPTEAESANSFLQPLRVDSANQDLDADEEIAVTPERIVESILFVGTPDQSPISARLLASLMRGVSPGEVEQYVERLNRQYEAEQASFRIVQEDLGFRMELAPSMIPVRNRFYGQVKEVRLNQQVIDVLSVVAYHQPVEKSEVERLIGRPTGAYLNQLLRRNLILVEKENGQKQYRTTERFLELFGLDELADLPQSEAMDDFES